MKYRIFLGFILFGSFVTISLYAQTLDSVFVKEDTLSHNGYEAKGAQGTIKHNCSRVSLS